MDRRSFLKGSVGGLALIAMAKGVPLAEASPDSFRLISINAVPSDVMAVAEKFTATGHFLGYDNAYDLPLEFRPKVLTCHGGMGNTEWHFFMGTEKFAEEVDMILRVIVPDKGVDLGYKYAYEIARTLGFPLWVYKDGGVEADFTEKAWESQDQAISGYCLGFIY
jgi:hypothetical protein